MKPLQRHAADTVGAAQLRLTSSEWAAGQSQPRQRNQPSGINALTPISSSATG